MDQPFWATTSHHLASVVEECEVEKSFNGKRHFKFLVSNTLLGFQRRRRLSQCQVPLAAAMPRFGHIVSEYVQYLLEVRPHQGLGHVLLPRPRCQPDVAGDDEYMSPLSDLAEVKREQRLSRLLKHYYRAAS